MGSGVIGNTLGFGPGFEGSSPSSPAMNDREAIQQIKTLVDTPLDLPAEPTLGQITNALVQFMTNVSKIVNEKLDPPLDDNTQQ